MFSVADGVLLRPLRFPDPDRLVHVWTSRPSSGEFRGVAAGATYLDWERDAESFEALRNELGLGDVGDDTLLALLLAWTQLFGLLTFELFGQTRNSVHDDEQLSTDAATTMARNIGLT